MGCDELPLRKEIDTYNMYIRTIGEDPWRRDLDTGHGAHVVEDGAAIAVTLDEVHERPDVHALGAVSDSGTNCYRNVVCNLNEVERGPI